MSMNLDLFLDGCYVKHEEVQAVFGSPDISRALCWWPPGVSCRDFLERLFHPEYIADFCKWPDLLPYVRNIAIRDSLHYCTYWFENGFAIYTSRKVCDLDCCSNFATGQAKLPRDLQAPLAAYLELANGNYASTWNLPLRVCKAFVPTKLSMHMQLLESKSSVLVLNDRSSFTFKENCFFPLSMDRSGESRNRRTPGTSPSVAAAESFKKGLEELCSSSLNKAIAEADVATRAVPPATALCGAHIEQKIMDVMGRQPSPCPRCSSASYKDGQLCPSCNYPKLPKQAIGWCNHTKLRARYDGKLECLTEGCVAKFEMQSLSSDMTHFHLVAPLPNETYYRVSHRYSSRDLPTSFAVPPPPPVKLPPSIRVVPARLLQRAEDYQSAIRVAEATFCVLLNLDEVEF